MPESDLNGLAVGIFFLFLKCSRILSNSQIPGLLSRDYKSHPGKHCYVILVKKNQVYWC